MQGADHNRFGRAAMFIVLTALLGIATATLSQCTQVSDNLTGVDLTKGNHGQCVSSCNKTHHALKKQESALHKANMKACRHDDKCKDAEDARHDAEKARLEQARKACKAECHKQGGGHSG